MAKIELIGGHIGIMLIIEMAKKELPGGHIRFTVNIDITEINQLVATLELCLL